MRGRFPVVALVVALALAGACHHDEYKADAGAGAACESGGSWEDPGTGLEWQDGPSCDAMSCGDAVTYCDALDIGGRTDWRLPGIGELRSLVLGCAAIETGGACGVTEGCMDISCWDLVCYGCGEHGGPGASGCYWDPELGGECATYWSSPTWNAGMFDACWYISFDGSYLNYVDAGNEFFARCVRGPGV